MKVIVECELEDLSMLVVWAEMAKDIKPDHAQARELAECAARVTSALYKAFDSGKVASILNL